jgi:hypothetical protein
MFKMFWTQSPNFSPQIQTDPIPIHAERSVTPSTIRGAAGSLLDVFVQAVAERIHRHDGREVLDRKMLHRFGRAELQERHVVHTLDRAGVELRGAADGIQVHRAVSQRPTAR